jgi:PST family polysaccharide transporter
MKSRRAAVLITVAQLTRQAGTAALFVVLARFISPDTFGVVALALVLVNFFVLWADLGAEPMVSRLSAIEAASYAVRSASVALLFSVCVAATLYLGSSQIGDLLGKNSISGPLATMSIAIPLSSMTAVLRGYCSASARFKTIAVSELLGFGSGALLAITLTIAGRPVSALTLQL